MPDTNNAQSQAEEKQAKSGKIFFLVFGLILFGSVFATFYRTIIAKNYIVETQVDCDPYEKACFVWECDPASVIEGERCTGEAKKDTWYYGLAKRKASKVPLCDPSVDENCAPMVCEPGEKDCAEIFCNAKTKVEQEVECSDPVEYAKNNPPEPEEDEEDSADEVGCEEGDTQCETESVEGLPADETDLPAGSQTDPIQTNGTPPTNATPSIK